MPNEMQIALRDVYPTEHRFDGHLGARPDPNISRRLRRLADAEDELFRRSQDHDVVAARRRHAEEEAFAAVRACEFRPSVVDRLTASIATLRRGQAERRRAVEDQQQIVARYRAEVAALVASY